MKLPPRQDRRAGRSRRSGVPDDGSGARRRHGPWRWRRCRRAAAALLPLALVAGMAAMAAGCASDDDEADQIKQLQERVLDLQRKAAVSDVELARLRQQLAELTGDKSLLQPPPARTWTRPAQIPQPSPPSSPSPPSQNAKAYTVPSYPPPPAAPSNPPGQIDVTDIVVPSAPPGPQRPAPAPAPRQVPAPAGTSGPPPGEGVPGMAAKGEAVTPAVQALYDRGYTLYHQKHYVDAEASFQRFLQAEPHSELADNAQYWIGECRYSRGDMRGALAAFREAVARYPNGNKTPDAMLKAGMSLEALGDKEGARTSYQEILRRFPGTAVAAVAEERRAKIP